MTIHTLFILSGQLNYAKLKGHFPDVNTKLISKQIIVLKFYKSNCNFER